MNQAPDLQTFHGRSSRTRLIAMMSGPAIAVVLLMAAGSRAAAEHADVPQDGLVLWLDAAQPDGQLSTEVSSDEPPRKLGTWSDLSGQSNDLRQEDKERQPEWTGSGPGGRPAVRFRGTSWLARDGLAGLSIGDQTFHITVVFQAPRGGPSAQRLLDLRSWTDKAASPEPRRGFWVGFQQSRYIPRLGIHDGDEGEALRPAWDNAPHLLEVVYSGEQQFEILVDGQTEQRAMFNGKHFLGFRDYVTLALGQHFGLQDSEATWFQGDVSELLLYQRPLTTPERLALGRHLSNKYSLTTSFESPPLFERDIAPILATHCFECHGEDTREAGLDLRTVSSMLHGGEAGPVIVRGHPEHSELFAMLHAGTMPPEDFPQMPADDINLIERWIRADAPAEEQVVIDRPPPLVTDEDRRHWAWQMPNPQTPPTVQQEDRVRNDIDRFLLAQLEAEGRVFSADATPAERVRRLWFDLTGLPPSPAELDAGLRDTEAGHWERLVDRLLQSQHFGERWGRFWLDVTGHVDVNGSDNDAAIIKPLRGKWRFRDYVIRSFNDDKPIDRFLVEQLAGDELYDWKSAESFSPEMLDALTATTFLLSANDDTDQNELNTPDVRHHVLQRVSENVASTLFAVTFQCAKCHDHKYEAVSQLDYYRFESVFAPVFNVRHWATSDSRTRPDVTDAEQQAIDQHNRQVDAEVASLEQQRDRIRTAHRDKLLQVRLETAPPSNPASVTQALDTSASERSQSQQQLLATYQSDLSITDAVIDAELSPEERDELSSIAARIPELKSAHQTYGHIAIATESTAATSTHVLRRGNYLRPGLEVHPELPEVLRTPATDPELAAASPADMSGRRLALAEAVTDPQSLAGNHVARVFVNRIWQQLFGRGIVETSDNFGVSGAAPSHPELLDWLTRRFIDSGWRLKPLIRLMVMSTAYQQSSHGEPSTFDPQNRLLWRMNLRQLDSEQLRDAILTVSGKLDRTLGGPPIPLDPRPDGMVVLKTDALPQGTTAWRRSVYILSRRNYHLTLMRVFDQPIVARTCAVRKPSAVVTQSLALLHDDFLLEQSGFLADRVVQEAASKSTQDRTTMAWKIVLGRAPDADELALCQELLARHTSRYSSTEDNPERQALVQLCHMLLNTSEFLYVQ